LSNPDTEKRHRLFAAAKPLFERYGFRKTTIEEICTEAGVSKRTFYEEFSDKADFFHELLHHRSRRFRDDFAAALSGAGGAREKVELFLETYADLIREEPIYRTIFETPELMTICAKKDSWQSEQSIVRILGDLIQEGVDAGEFRPMDARIAAWLVGIMLDDVYLVLPELFKLPGALEDSKLAGEARSFILSGLLAR